MSNILQSNDTVYFLGSCGDSPLSIAGNVITFMTFTSGIFAAVYAIVILFLRSLRECERTGHRAVTSFHKCTERFHLLVERYKVLNEKEESGGLLNDKLKASLCVRASDIKETCDTIEYGCILILMALERRGFAKLLLRLMWPEIERLNGDIRELKIEVAHFQNDLLQV